MSRLLNSKEEKEKIKAQNELKKQQAKITEINRIENLRKAEEDARKKEENRLKQKTIMLRQRYWVNKSMFDRYTKLIIDSLTIGKANSLAYIGRERKNYRIEKLIEFFNSLDE